MEPQIYEKKIGTGQRVQSVHTHAKCKKEEKNRAPIIQSV